MMSLLKAALRSNFTFNTFKFDHVLPFFIRQSPRQFSIETEAPPRDSAAASDPFLRDSISEGFIYGRLYGIRAHTLKTDIINLLEGCNLTMDSIKVQYNGVYSPLDMMVQFRSRHAFDQAIRAIARKGRLYKLEREGRYRDDDWDRISTFDGKTVLLRGFAPNAQVEDVDRFLSGCVYDSSSIKMFVRGYGDDLIRMATVRFPSRTGAMNAFITKNGSFCLNSQILVRVLQ